MVIPAASRLKNVQWDTQTVLFGWASQGVWPPELGGTEVTFVFGGLSLMPENSTSSRLNCFEI